MSKKGKPDPKAVLVEAPPPPPKDTTSDDLVALVNERRAAERLELAEFSHRKYEYWNKYFGFTVEREQRWTAADEAKGLTKARRGVPQLGSVPGATLPTSGRSNKQSTEGVLTPRSVDSKHTAVTVNTIASGGTTAAAPGGKTAAGGSHRRVKDNVDPFRAAALAHDAGVHLDLRNDLGLEPCLTSKGYDPIDEAAMAMGAMPGEPLTKIADTVCASYATPTWRQSQDQCNAKKVRALYRWVCNNFKITPPPPPPVKENTAGGSGTVGFSVPGDSAPQTGRPPKPPKEEKPAKGGKGKGAAPAVASIPVEQEVVDPIEIAMSSRSAEPATLADIFAAMCTQVGVPCESVKGTLKGTVDTLGKPVGAMTWGWNLVTLAYTPPTTLPEGMDSTAAVSDARGPATSHRFLLDLAMSMVHVGPRAAASAAASQAPPDSAPTGGGKSGQTPRQAAKEAKGANSLGNTVALDATTSGSATTNSLTSDRVAFAHTLDFSPHFEPFYYFTDPREFAATHYPDDANHLVFGTAVSRTAWEVYPRLDHEFFTRSLVLDSHARRSVVVLKRVPTDVTFRCDDLVHTDVRLVVFKGPAANLSATLEKDEQLDQRFVWQQRSEAEGRVTFTVMAPDVGLYTFVLAARTLPGPIPNSDALVSTPFVPVASYQVTINFVPVNDPMFPVLRQAPFVAKVVEPVTHKVGLGGQQNGSVRFTVVPCMPTVRAVAVVNRIFKVQTAAPKNNDSLLGGVAAQLARLNAGAPAKPEPPAPPVKGKGAAGKGKNAAQQQAPPPPPPEEQLPAGRDAPPAIDRVEYHLLSPDAEAATFDGVVPLEVGLVEVWAMLHDDRQDVQPYNTKIHSPNKTTMMASRGPSQPQADGTATDAAATPGQTPAAQTQQAPAASAPPPQGDILGSTLTASPPVAVDTFIPLLQEVKVVKRIPAKEFTYNDGRPLLEPACNVEQDRAKVLRLLTKATNDGRTVIPTAVDKTAAPLAPVGGYFSGR